MTTTTTGMIRNTSSQTVGRARSSAHALPAARRCRETEAGRAPLASAVTLREEELDILGLPLQADRLAFCQILPGADVLRSLGHDRLTIGKAAVKLHDVAQVLQEDERGEDLIRSFCKRTTAGACSRRRSGDATGAHRRVEVLTDGDTDSIVAGQK